MSTMAKIIGTGQYSPPNIVTNDDIAKIVDTSDEWINSRTGIKSRYLANDTVKTTSATMAFHASSSAIKKANISASELDMIIFATCTADYQVPSNACLLQKKLKATKACAFDIAAACAGSLYGLSIAKEFIQSKKYKNILVVGSEMLSNAIDWSDRNTCVLFGDAAGAAVLTASKNSGLVDIDLYADGNQWQTIIVPAGGCKNPITAERIAAKENKIKMNGQDTFKYAVKKLTSSAKNILEKHKLGASDISHVVAHQANLRIIEAVSKRTKLPMSKFIINIDRFANTSSASLLTTFNEGVSLGKIKDGDIVLLLAIGAGFAWGAGIYKA